MMDMNSTLDKIASVIRSKNAGPFEICIDIMFPDDASYQAARSSASLTKQAFAELYDLLPEQCEVVWFDAARAIKCTMPRRVPGGDPSDMDVYGAQHYRRVMSLTL